MHRYHNNRDEAGGVSAINFVQEKLMQSSNAEPCVLPPCDVVLSKGSALIDVETVARALLRDQVFDRQRSNTRSARCMISHAYSEIDLLSVVSQSHERE